MKRTIFIILFICAFVFMSTMIMSTYAETSEGDASGNAIQVITEKTIAPREDTPSDPSPEAYNQAAHVPEYEIVDTSVES